MPPPIWSAGGALLSAGINGVAGLRPARKPLHPRGEVTAARLRRTGSTEPTGVRWIDEPGEGAATVRLSRAIGLPGGLPDIHGLAVRVSAEGGDLLFASTGLGTLTRFVLTAARGPRRRPMTTLFPYETDTGPLLLAAVGLGERDYELSWARPTGPWHPFARLLLDAASGGDPEIAFDPVRRQIEGLRQYPALVRLREPSYRDARRRRTSADRRPVAGMAEDTEG